MGFITTTDLRHIISEIHKDPIIIKITECFFGSCKKEKKQEEKSDNILDGGEEK